MRTAARVSKTFCLDPVAVLASEDEFELTVRAAAMRVVQEDERKQNEASARAGRKR